MNVIKVCRFRKKVYSFEATIVWLCSTVNICKCDMMRKFSNCVCNICCIKLIKYLKRLFLSKSVKGKF